MNQTILIIWLRTKASKPQQCTGKRYRKIKQAYKIYRYKKSVTYTNYIDSFKDFSAFLLEFHFSYELMMLFNYLSTLCCWNFARTSFFSEKKI